MATVYSPEGWCKHVETVKTVSPFKVVRMEPKYFMDRTHAKSKLAFRSSAVDGSKVKIQKATVFKIDAEQVGRLLLKYTDNEMEAWQEVNIGQKRCIW